MSTPPNDDDGTILARFYAYAIRVQEDQQIIHLQAKQRLQIAETQAMSLLEVISPKQHPIAIHAVLQSHHQYAHQVYEDQQIIYLQSKRRLEEAQGVVHALALKIQAQSKKQQGPPDPAEESAKPTTPTVTTDTDTRTELPDLAKESATPTDKRTEPTEAVSSKPTKPASKKVASMKPTTSLKSSEPTESNKRGPGRPRKSDSKRNSPEESLRDAPRGPGRPRKLESKSDPIEKPLLDDATGDQAPKALSNEMTTINTPQKKISGKSSKKSSRRKTAFNGSFVELDEEDILTDPEDVIPKYGHKGSAASSKMGAAPEQEVSVQDGDYDDDEGSQVSQQEGAEGSKQDTKKRRRQKSLIPKNLKRKKRPQSLEEVVADGLAKAAEEEMRAVSLTQEKTVEERHTEALRVKEIMAFELGG